MHIGVNGYRCYVIYRSKFRFSDFSRLLCVPAVFPFYTLGRFQNLPCVGSNQLMGTCVLAGECTTANGVATGSCNSITRQAVCCVCKFKIRAEKVLAESKAFLLCFSFFGRRSTNVRWIDVQQQHVFCEPKLSGTVDRWLVVSTRRLNRKATQNQRGRMKNQLLILLRRCSLTVNPCSSTVCQLRIVFSDLSLAPPNGDGTCNTDIISITGGSTQVPNLCGENAGQHVVVEFDGTNPIQITVTSTSSYTFGRHWFIYVTQINCDSQFAGE